MIVKENVTVYKCGFCKKKLFVKHAMDHHEKYCGCNPENFKACEGCIHLEEIEVEYDLGDGYENEPVTRKATGFNCKKLNKKMYPTKAERKGLPTKYPWTFQDQVPMPKECSERSDAFEFYLNQPHELDPTGY